MLDEFRVKLFRTVVIAALGRGCDFPPQFGNAAFEDDFRCVRQDLWGRRSRGMQLLTGGLEKVAGTFPLLFILFLLFSLGDMGVTRGVTWMSPGLVTGMSLGAGDCDVTRGLVTQCHQGLCCLAIVRR